MLTGFRYISIALLMTALSSMTMAEETTYGLYVDRNGTLMIDNKPFRGIGVNYFNAFYRTLKNPDDTSYRDGFRTLAEYKIPFVRFMCSGFWPIDNKLYTTDKERYFKLLDGVIETAEEYKIGLIPSLFWNICTVPDMVKEPVDQWGNPKSKTHEFMRQYTKEIITRYKDSPAIWGWEFGNEYNLAADLPNASEHRPPVWPALGTAETRSKRDELTHDMIRRAFSEFAKEVRKYDTHRIVITGNSIPRPSAWHQKKELSWKPDTEDQYVEMLAGDNPDPTDTISIHLYPSKDNRFNREDYIEDVIKVTLDASRKLKKPLFIGEFGSGNNKNTPDDQVQKKFTEILDAILEMKVPLAALWVYDFKAQDGEWNVTDSNSRSYQLKAISEANKKVNP